MAIYGPDGTVIFRKEEQERHHIWCNRFMEERLGCKMCERLYLKYPIRDHMMGYFPNAVVRK